MTDARPAEHANELSKIDKTRFCVAFFVFSFAWMLVTDRCCSAAAAAFG